MCYNDGIIHLRGYNDNMFEDKLKLFSFFSGAGFLDLGFEDSGYDVLYVNEFYKPFLHAYKYSREQMGRKGPEYDYFNGDISALLENKEKRKLRGLIKEQHDKANFVGFVGGPPCPDFSVGGKNMGRNGDKGRLTATYIQLICQLKPDFFLFENVKGLWKTRKHREFYEEVKKELHSNGFMTTERLINSLEYGVPQDRERIILLGFRKNFLQDIGKTVKRNKYSITDLEWDSFIKYSREDISNIPWPETNPFEAESTLQRGEGIPENLTVEYWFSKNNVTNHANAEDFFKPKSGMRRFQTVDEGDDSRKSFKRLHRWRYSPTAAYGNNEVHLHPYRLRRLSASEALAVQSLPTEFVLPEDMTLTDKFKTIGNGVPYLAAKSLAQTITNYIEK